MRRIAVMLLIALFLLGGWVSPSMSLEETENPLVTLEVEGLGEIVIELFPDVAPNTVRNFIFLVEAEFYNDTTFHRVIPRFVIQGGDPLGTGRGGPGYMIPGEFSANGFANDLLHTRGVISMARSQNPDSAGSQFFIVVEDAPHLDGSYAAFGQVVEGMDVVDQVVAAPRNAQDRPLEDQVVVKVSLETFGIDYPAPEVVE